MQKMRNVSRLQLIGLLSHAFGAHLLLNGIIADLVEFQSSHIIKCWITQPLSPTVDENSDKSAASYDFWVTLFNTEVDML